MNTTQFIFRNRRIVAIIAVLVALLSFFVLAPIFEKPNTFSKQIDSLTEKQNTLYGLTAAAAVSSAAISAVPGDTTTAVADSITDLTTFFVISLGAVFFEKYFITSIGFISFKILIPIACALILGFLMTGYVSWWVWAKKTFIFALVIIAAIPLSTSMADKIVAVNEETIIATVEIAEDEADVSEEGRRPFQWITDAVTGLTDGIQNISEKAKEVLQGFITSVAVMLVATCIMPLIAIIIVLIAAKFLFGVTIDVPVRKLTKEYVRKRQFRNHQEPNTLVDYSSDDVNVEHDEIV